MKPYSDPWESMVEPTDYFSGLRTSYACPVDNLLGFVRRSGAELIRMKGPEHFHSRWLWIQARTGTAINVIRGRPMSLKPGEMLLIPGATPHYHQADPDESLEWCFLTFDCTNSLWRSSLGGRVLMPSPEARTQFESAVVNMRKGKAAQAALRLSLFHEFLLDQHGLEPKLQDRWLARIQEWAGTVEGVPTIEGLAEVLGGSASHLRATFRKRTGLSLGGYLTHLRMLRAVEALQYPDRPITGIAYDLGYSTPGNFSRAFQREMGMSPRAYRESCSG